MAEQVCLVNDNDRGNPLFKGAAPYFALDVVEEIIFTEAGLCTETRGDLPVKIHDSKRGKAAVEHFIQGRVERGRPYPGCCCLSSPRASGDDAEAFYFFQVIQAHLCFGHVCGIKNDVLCILEKRVEF